MKKGTQLLSSCQGLPSLTIFFRRVRSGFPISCYQGIQLMISQKPRVTLLSDQSAAGFHREFTGSFASTTPTGSRAKVTLMF